jgi:hypothetical protein
MIVPKICESIRAGSGDESPQHGLNKDHQGIDMLPIVTRGCLCELAIKIGFDSHITSQYSLANQIQVRINQIRNKYDNTLNIF